MLTPTVRVKLQGRASGALPVKDSLVVDGSAQVTVTWSTAVHVITETPVFLLGTHTRSRCQRRVIKSFSVSKNLIKAVRGSHAGFHVALTGHKHINTDTLSHTHKHRHTQRTTAMMS